MSTEQWSRAFAQALREVDPSVDAERAEAAMRWAFTVPRPRDPRDDFEPPAEDALSQRESDYVADREEAKETRSREGR